MTAAEPDLLDRLIAIRKWRGLTQCQVADRIPVARSYISLIETRVRIPKLNILEAYARVIGAEIGAWPIPMPEPPEIKRPPIACHGDAPIMVGRWVPNGQGAAK